MRSTEREDQTETHLQNDGNALRISCAVQPTKSLHNVTKLSAVWAAGHWVGGSSSSVHSSCRKAPVTSSSGLLSCVVVCVLTDVAKDPSAFVQQVKLL